MGCTSAATKAGGLASTGGEWTNLGSRAGQIRFFEALTVAEALAESTADVLDLMGLTPTSPL
jgi:hypothetical protein